MNIYPINRVHNTEVSEAYRNHKLVFYTENEKCIGEVYKDHIKVAYCEALDMTSTLQASRTLVDRLIKEHIVERKNATPTRNEFIKALALMLPYLSKEQRAILFSQLTHDNKAIELERLKHIVGCQSTTDIYLILASFSRALCDELAYEPPMPVDGKDPFIAMVLEPEENYTHTENSIKLKLQANIYSALRSTNWQ